MRQTLAKAFIGIVFLLVSFPMLNTMFLKKDIGPLSGVDDTYTQPAFSLSAFWDGTYQQQFETYCSYGFSGYRFAMRALNEFRFRLFDEADDIVVCKDGSVIFEHYLDEFLGLSGTHFCSPDYLDETAARLRRISALAESAGKELVVVITPNKADFIAEQIPDRFYQMDRAYGQEQRGRRQLTARLDQAGIAYVDSAELLQSHEYPFPVFPQTGIHWTREAAIQAVDALIDCLEDGGYTLKRIGVEGREEQACPRRGYMNSDDDIWQLMNIFSTKETTYSYPIETELIPESYDLPAVFVQGGSFTFTLLELLADHDIVRDLDFLFYDIALYDYDRNRSAISGLDDPSIRAKVQDSDVILLEVNEEKIYDMGSGFLPVLEEILAGPPAASPEQGGELQIAFRDMGPWESANGVSWRWAYGNDALLVCSNVGPDDGIAVSFWVPYSGYVAQDPSCGESVDIDVYVNGKPYTRYRCSQDSIFDVTVDSSWLVPGRDNTIEIRSPYTMRTGAQGVDPPGGVVQKEVSVQILSAGRVG